MKNSQGRNRRQGSHDEEEDGPTDDAMDWAYLGREAAFKGNKRPATIDFLLGPLSVTKKIRTIKARRQGLRRDNANLVRPIEVTQDEATGTENNSNTMMTLVKGIYDILKGYFIKNPQLQEDGINLFKFIVNPESFGQTIENIFYLSFLVKDGFVALGHNDDGLPILRMSLYCSRIYETVTNMHFYLLVIADPPTQEDHKKMSISRKQVIFPMTMWEWQETKRIFNITESMIPTREQQKELTSATGWYS